MKLITRETDYAIRALCFIAGSKEKKVSVHTLVEKLKIPRPFLRKLLQVLNKHKVLLSTKGSGGGFSLRVVPSKISLIDIIAIFQGPFSINECFLKKAPCPRKAVCGLRKKIQTIEKIVATELQSVTIASLLKNKE